MSVMAINFSANIILNDSLKQCGLWHFLNLCFSTSVES